MSVVTLLGVDVKNNPAKFTDKFEFEITFECLEPLQKDLEWKLTYVGSATSDQYDQELDSLDVGPVPLGVSKFFFEAPAPDTKRIPDSDVLGVTVILLTGSYDGREFYRVGWYCSNEYDSDELNAEPPTKPIFERIRRNILAEKPRVTRFAIKWDSEESAPPEFPPEQPEADLAADEEEYGAEEAEVEAAAEAQLNEESAAGGDTEMDGGVKEEETGAAAAAAAIAAEIDEEDIDDEGSVDLEGESEDELEEVDGDAMEEDAMEVDGAEKPNGQPAEVVMST